MRHAKKPSIPTVALIAMLCGSLARYGHGAPADPIASSAPVLGGNDAPEPRDLEVGDSTVSTQTGALQYGYPIDVPPGRLGMEPSLSLTYSSQGSVYGTLASGWTLSVPHIEIDTSVGIMHDAHFANTYRDYHYVSGLAGGRRLVPVAEPWSKGSTVVETYRVQHDDTFARYELMRVTDLNDGDPNAQLPGGALPEVTWSWQVFTTDGVTHYFGDSENMGGTRDWTRAPLTRSVDSFGNTVEYFWSKVLVGSGYDYALDRIEYTSNAGAGLGATAKVEFAYDPIDICFNTTIPIGAAFTYRTGKRQYRGAKKLRAITTSVRGTTAAAGGTLWRTVREVDLGYHDQPGTMDTERCDQPHAPVRLLASIQETAYRLDGTVDTLPPVQFSYGEMERTLDTALGFGWLSGAIGEGTREPGYWPSVERMHLDLDGDGLIDRLEMTDDPLDPCKFNFYPNTGDGFGAPMEIDLPNLPWEFDSPAPAGPTERCSFSGQVTLWNNLDGTNPCPPGYQGPNMGSYLAYRFMDMNGDGLPEMVAALNHDPYWLDPNAQWFPGLRRETEGGWGWPSCSPLRQLPLPDLSCMQSGFGYSNPDNPDEFLWEFEPQATEQCLDNATWHPGDEVIGQRAGPDEHYTQPNSIVVEAGEPPLPEPEGVPAPGCNRRRNHERCDQYPWLVYWNRGDGNFEEAPDIILQPFGLDSDVGESSVGSEGGAARSHAFTDIDGDGLLDAVARATVAEFDPTEDVEPHWWYVLRNDGSGKFIPAENAQPYVWEAPPHATPTKSGSAQDTVLLDPTWRAQLAVMSLMDVNGDGLPDFVQRGNPDSDLEIFEWSPVYVYYNTGTGFEIGDPFGSFWDYATNIADVVNYPSASRSENLTMSDETWVAAGDRYAYTRAQDLDMDGRADFFVCSVISGLCEGGYASLHFNAGDEFLDGVQGLPPRVEKAMQQHVEVSSLSPPLGDWYVWEDYLDVDGDGYPDHVDAERGSVFTDQRLLDGKPPRLLNLIDNGQGAVTDITYIASPKELLGSRGMPSPTWLVKEIETRDFLFEPGATDTTSGCEKFDGSTGTCIAAATSYTYADAVWSPDPATGKYGFRGFERVETTLPSTATTVQLYDYDVDWSGRLAETQTFPGDTSTAPEKVSETVWQALTLFGGVVTTFHPQETRSYVCGGAATVGACKAVPRWLKETNQWDVMVSDLTGGEVLWALASTTTEEVGAPVVDRRKAEHDHHVYADTYVYRVREYDTAHEFYEPGSGAWEIYARTQTTWDVTRRVDKKRVVWVDNNPLAARTTARVYDMTTGQATKLIRPAQFDAGGWSAAAYRTYAYDDEQLYVLTTTDVRDDLEGGVPLQETDHVVQNDYDLGTGAVVASCGPNFGPGGPGACGMSGSEAEGVLTTLDGFGRPIEQRVAFDAGSGDYTYELVSKTTYDDTVDIYTTPAKRAEITEEQLIELGGSDWITTKTDFDGHGRALTVRQLLAQPSVYVTSASYEYDREGNMVGFTTRHPDQDHLTVTYTYDYDNFGRPTTLYRPDGDPSIKDAEIIYNGLVRTRREVSSDSSPAAETELHYDVFGRLRQVREAIDGASWAATTYEHSPRDEVAYILNPEGIETWLTHNWAGERTQIDRGEQGTKTRTWSYDYDKNGNLITQTSPVPQSGDAADYTTSIAYDDLDRVTSRVAGLADMDPTDAAEVGAGGFTSFSYDAAVTNGIGHLRAAGVEDLTGAKLITTVYDYDARGNTTNTLRNFNLASLGMPALTDTREVASSYNAAGQVTTVTYGEGTQTETTYDLRGLPYETTWSNGPSDQSMLGRNDRSLAGTVTRRWRVGGFGDTNGEQEVTWSYDSLGRITDQTVTDTFADPFFGGDEIRGRQTIEYWDTDDPKKVSTLLDTGGGTIAVNYVYDKRHQLVGVYDDTGDLDEDFAHLGDGRLDTAFVAHTGAPPQLVQRDVSYVYGDANHPEAVTELSDGGTLPVAEYAYDNAGNVISRGHGLVCKRFLGCSLKTTTFTYDGENRQRKVAAYGGDEELYFYDHAGSRVLAVRKPSGSVDRVRLWAGPTEVWYDGSGTVTKTWAHVSMGTPIARIENGSDLELHYHTTLQHLLVSLDHTAEIEAGFSYGPYGEILDQVGTSSEIDDHLRRFNGKEYDTLSSLSYYGFRYYDPLSLTWTQSDPLYRVAPDAAYDDPRRMGLYVFNLNNPLRYLDPDGRQPQKREWNIQIYTVGATNIDPDVGREVETHLQKKFQAIAGKGVRVNVRKTKITPEQARNLPRTAANTTVIIVIKVDPEEEPHKRTRDSEEALEGSTGRNLNTDERNAVRQAHRNGRGFGRSVGNRGAAVVDTRDMERGDPERTDQQRSDFGKTLLEHEAGHTLGLGDQPAGSGSMMDHEIDKNDTPRRPTPEDRTQMREEIQRRSAQ